MHTLDFDYENFRSTDDEYLSRMVRKLAYEAKNRSRHKNRNWGLEEDFDVDDGSDGFGELNRHDDDTAD